MTTPVKSAFEATVLELPLDRLLPTKQVTEAIRATQRYKTIAASIPVVGVIEPLVVFPQPDGRYLLLDGHVRLETLQKMGTKTVDCLVSKDDEGYTYNHKVNYVAPIQENRMILKAIEAGVTVERIAQALNMTPETVRRRCSMLNGICSDVVNLFKDKPIFLSTLQLFRGVNAVRQMEMADLMIAMKTYTRAYAQAMVAATPPEALVASVSRRSTAVRSEDLAKVERELRTMEQSVLDLRETYGRNVMNLMLARTWLKQLLDNARAVSFLARKQPETLALFQRIVEATSLDA